MSKPAGYQAPSTRCQQAEQRMNAACSGSSHIGSRFAGGDHVSQGMRCLDSVSSYRKACAPPQHKVLTETPRR